MSPVFQLSDPIQLFQLWFQEAQAHEPNDPEAMSLATVNASGQPSVRIVLMRDIDADGFSFFTNYASRKGQDLMDNNKAAICFHWKSLKKQIRAQGRIVRLDDAISDKYFFARHPESQLGAWASLQSQELDSRETLEKRLSHYREQFSTHPMTRPVHWGGYKLIVDQIEFWHDRPHRLHDRELFTRTAHGWDSKRLYP